MSPAGSESDGGACDNSADLAILPLVRSHHLILAAAMLWLPVGAAAGTEPPPQAGGAEAEVIVEEIDKIEGAAPIERLPDGTSPAHLCDDLCRKLYGDHAERRALCKQGCKEAERCTKRCEEQFPADSDKLARCNYRCARAR